MIICWFAPGTWGFPTSWLPAARSSVSGTEWARVSMDKQPATLRIAAVADLSIICPLKSNELAPSAAVNPRPQRHGGGLRSADETEADVADARVARELVKDASVNRGN